MDSVRISSLRRTMQCTFFFTLLLLFVHQGYSQNTNSNNNNNADGEIDEDLIDRQDDTFNLEGCIKDMVLSDRNGDGVLKRNEYLNFIQEYGKRICYTTDRLEIQQSSTFIRLACNCIQEPDSESDCCIGDKAQIPTTGASSTDRTQEETNFLTTVCSLTRETFDAACPPVIADRGEPIVPIVPDNTATGAGSGEGGGLSNGAKWGIIAAIIALLLLCCLCFVCVWKRQRVKDDEEEQEVEFINDEENVATAAPKDVDVEQPMDRTTLASSDNTNQSRGMDVDDDYNNEPDIELNNVSPAGVNPMIATSMARGDIVGEDSDEEEEVRQKRGGGIINDDPDDDIIKYRGAPPIPPPEPEPQPPLILRPIPDKYESDDGWDQPGRNIDYPVESDEISAGEVEHYDPDGGVYFPQRPTKDPLDWNRAWNRPKTEDPDDVDKRKHRIQTGLGEGEVWNKLAEESFHNIEIRPTGDAFDWVVQSALGALEDTQRNTRNNDTITNNHNNNASSTATMTTSQASTTATKSVNDGSSDDIEHQLANLQED